MSRRLTSPVAKTIAFGGVPAGSAKSHEAANALAVRTGRERGSTLSITLAVAVFDATADSAIVAVVAIPSCASSGRCSTAENDAAIDADRPLFIMPAASA